MIPQRYTKADAAALYRCSVKHVQRAINRGELRAEKFAGKWVMTERDLEAWQRGEARAPDVLTPLSTIGMDGMAALRLQRARRQAA